MFRLSKLIRVISWLEIVAVIVGGYFFARAAAIYRVNSGTAPTISEHGICRVVTNNSGKDIFIPTNTSSEWNSFINKPPAGVSLSNCSYTVEYFIMGGGGGGGGIGPWDNGGGGGGGAGGYLTGSTTVTAGNNVTITVGAGGAGGSATAPFNPSARGGNGGNSSAFGLVAYGGGGGGSGDCSPAIDYYTLCSSYAVGLNGGSGGGNGYNPGSCAAAAGAGTPGQGNHGGWSCYGGGGGGGAGGPQPYSGWGTGGVGVANNWIDGVVRYYGAGGSTGGTSGRTSPPYGCISGDNGPGGPTSWYGAGGCAAFCDRGSPDACPSGSAFTGSAGYSGLVIIRYLGSQRGAGGTVTSSGGYTVHYWGSPGVYTFSP